MRGLGLKRAVIAVVVELTSAALCAGPAAADTRTATLTDGPDPGVTFDIAQIQVQTDRDAGSLSLTATFHSPIPATLPLASGPHYLAVWIKDAKAGDCLVGGGVDGKLGDVSVNVSPDFMDASILEATANVRFRQEYPDVPLQVSPDRRQISLTISDPLLQQSNHRCLTAAGSGQAAYDPSQPSGGSKYDSTGDVWFDGQAPGGGTGASGCVGPLLRLSGAQRLAHGSTGPIDVLFKDDFEHSYTGGAVLTMADATTGSVFYRHAFTRKNDRALTEGEGVFFYIDLDPERRPATVTLTWTQRQPGGDTYTCSAAMPVASFRGSRPDFVARGGGIGELIQRGRRCWEVRGERVTVTVRGSGRRARFTRNDGCGLFSGKGRRIGPLRVRATRYGTLSFSSLGGGSASLTVKVGRRVVLRRKVITTVRSRPDRRIVEGTDEFFNYCIKGGKELFSHELRLYCIKPGSTRSAVRFR